MKRINVYTADGNGVEQYEGWFDNDAATEIASYAWGNPYVNGKVLFATAKGKLVVNSWNNTGYDNYRFAEDEEEIAEILSSGGYEEDDKKLTEILDKYEI